MDTIFTFFLTIHILGGLIGLLSGAINMIIPKGTPRHQKVGRWFVRGMLSAGASSFVLAVLHPNYFLFMVGVFTLYMVGTGQRYLLFKSKSYAVTRVDWAFTLAMLVASLWFIPLGIIHLWEGNFFGLVFITFGGFGLSYVWLDIKNFRGKSHLKNFWLTEHIQRMVGGFIASSTAFLVVNVKYFPEGIPMFIYWLLPTVLMTPILSKWVKKHQIKKLN